MDEDLEREKWILALQSCARKCLNDLDSIPQELEILRYMEKMKEAGKDPRQEVASNHVRYVRYRRGYEAASQKPMQVLKIGRDLSVTRESIKADVFKPWWNLPTRSMDDYAEQEMRHMREVEAAQAQEEELETRIATLRNRMQELLQKRNNLLGLLEEKRRDISAISSIPAGAEQYRDYSQSRLKGLLAKANDHLLKFDKVNRKAMSQFLLFSERVGGGSSSHP